MFSGICSHVVMVISTFLHGQNQDRYSCSQTLSPKIKFPIDLHFFFFFFQQNSFLMEYAVFANENAPQGNFNYILCLSDPMRTVDCFAQIEIFH